MDRIHRHTCFKSDEAYNVYCTRRIEVITDNCKSYTKVMQLSVLCMWINVRGGSVMIFCMYVNSESMYIELELQSK